MDATQNSVGFFGRGWADWSCPALVWFRGQPEVVREFALRLLGPPCPGALPCLSVAAVAVTFEPWF